MMPKNWEAQRENIRNLYIKDSLTLKDVRRVMIERHGFIASIRSYKLKLDEWNVRKNKMKTPSRHQKKDVEETQSFLPPCDMIEIPCPTISRDVSDHAVPSIRTHNLPSRCKAGFLGNTEYGTIATTRLNVSPIIQITNNQFSPRMEMVQCGPLVNSSLMFFSTQTDSENLRQLAQFPGIAPRAIEILFRNWKDGGEYLSYATAFLQISRCCETIIGVNWTRWTHRDETLFDLVDENVGIAEQGLLYKLLLKADLTFRHPLSTQNAPWALIWRTAIEQEEWALAKNFLMILEFQPVLLNSAFVVVAEYYLERIKGQIAWWKEDKTRCPRTLLRQHRELVTDCNELKLEVRRLSLDVGVEEVAEFLQLQETHQLGTIE